MRDPKILWWWLNPLWRNFGIYPGAHSLGQLPEFNLNKHQNLETSKHQASPKPIRFTFLSGLSLAPCQLRESFLEVLRRTYFRPTPGPPPSSPRVGCARKSTRGVIHRRGQERRVINPHWVLKTLSTVKRREALKSEEVLIWQSAVILKRYSSSDHFQLAQAGGNDTRVHVMPIRNSCHVWLAKNSTSSSWGTFSSQPSSSQEKPTMAPIF